MDGRDEEEIPAASTTHWLTKLRLSLPHSNLESTVWLTTTSVILGFPKNTCAECVAAHLVGTLSAETCNVISPAFITNRIYFKPSMIQIDVPEIMQHAFPEISKCITEIVATALWAGTVVIANCSLNLLQCERINVFFPPANLVSLYLSLYNLMYPLKVATWPDAFV